MGRSTGGPRAVVIVTGSELVRGDLPDGNGPFVARELARLGLEPERLVVVGDRPDLLAAALREGVEADLCIVSGGLGPTHDDRTIETLAAALGRGLALDEALRDEIETFSREVAARLGRPYADFEPGVEKQASLPAGGVSLGLAGTAPAVLVEHQGRVAVALPGPPGELRRLWPRVLAHPAFRRLAAAAEGRVHRTLRFFGPSESAVARALAEAGGEGDGTEVTVCARDLEIHVDLYHAPGGGQRAGALAAALREAFPGEVVAEDDGRPVEELVLALCRERGLTLALAESCTGGLVGARLTAVPGASAVFLGGLVTYGDAAKVAVLGVQPATLAAHGAVSAETAAAMAAGARAALGADVALAVTGIAGPGGGTPAKPVGLVFLHAAAPAGESASSFVLPGDRDAVRTRATALSLHALRGLLTRSGADARA